MIISVGIMVIIAILAIMDQSRNNNELGIGAITFFLGFLEIIFFFNATKNLNFGYSDLIVYYGYYQTMLGWNWTDFLSLHPFEFGYDLIVFIIAKIQYALGWQFTAHNFVLILTILMVAIVYFAAKIQTNRSSAVFIALLYLWYQYSNVFSYNIVRQGLALAFLSLSISLYQKYRRILPAFVVLVIATTFHSSILFLGAIPFFIIVFKHLKYTQASKESLSNTSINNNVLISQKMWFFLLVGTLAYVTRLNSFLGKLPISLLQTYQSDSVAALAAGIGIETNSLHFLLIALGYMGIVSFIWYYNRTKIDDLYPFYLLFFSDTVIYLFMGFVPFSFRIEFAALYILPLIFGIIIYRTGNKVFYMVLLLVVITLGYYTGPFYLLK
ncbi:EpsG family protein [Leuconostoc lactis]|uniref:EpsG family protein n=1 Tax=Leuconostoc lactis TaxID=1246 RepID=UPI000A8C9C17|nr:EpsG family protein [Leuconostoc lactis]